VKVGGNVIAYVRQLQAVARRDCSLSLVFHFASSSFVVKRLPFSTLLVFFS
jgi:hypothetical protein